jgi:hypothetical protein
VTSGTFVVEAVTHVMTVRQAETVFIIETRLVATATARKLQTANFRVKLTSLTHSISI